MLNKGGWSRTRRWSSQLMVLGGVLLGASAQAQAQAATAAPVANGAVEVKLHEVPVKVTASSVLPDAKNPGRYGPANLLDEDPTTIWAEGAQSTGAGEWVELSFPPGTRIYAFLVTPGNPKSAQLYQANARPKKAKLELKLAEGRQLNYDLDFPKNFPAGGAIYVEYAREWAIESARLTGSLLPPDDSNTAAWLRAYSQVPYNGALPAPELELDVSRNPLDEWGSYRRALGRAVAGASSQSELFRVTPASSGKGYVFDPSGPPNGKDSYANFRIRWEFIQGAWRVVELDMMFREDTPDD